MDVYSLKWVFNEYIIAEGHGFVVVRWTRLQAVFIFPCICMFAVLYSLMRLIVIYRICIIDNDMDP